VADQGGVEDPVDDERHAEHELQVQQPGEDGHEDPVEAGLRALAAERERVPEHRHRGDGEDQIAKSGMGVEEAVHLDSSMVASRA
jgi:hypothetical protein